MQHDRLLFIDDETSVLSALRNYFEALGHEVATATDGREGLGLYGQLRPHLVILDLKMPGMSGMEVLDAMVKRNAVVIMLTGHGEIESAVQAMRLGAENFLQKPVDMPHLETRLFPSLQRRLARAAAIVVLVVASVGLGARIGAESSERPTRPIPVPIESPDSAIAAQGR